MRKLYLLCVLLTLLSISSVSLVSAETYTCAPGTYIAAANNVRVRAAANTGASQLALLRYQDGVLVTGGVKGTMVRGSDLWCGVSMTGDQVGYVHSTLLIPAPELTSVAPIQIPTSPAQFSGMTATPIPTMISTPIPVAPSGFVCPRNCAGAVTMGLSPQQAATCPGLDRDHDGVACYGD